METVSISFDDENRVRVLDPQVFKRSEELAEECKSFASKMQEFSQCATGVMEFLEAHASHIEKQKLKAIGVRNLVDGEMEGRAQQKKTLQALIQQRMADLDRENLAYQSLLRMEAEQEALIEKLSNSEAGSMASESTRK